MSDTQASGPTKKLYDTLSTVRHMPGVTHAIRRLCDDALSEYDEALAARESQPAPRTRLEPDGFDYTTGNEVVVNRRVPAEPPAGEDWARLLAIKARELLDGMRLRVKRDPDIADFQAAFEPIIQRERVSADALRKIVEKWRKEAMEFMGEGGIGADIHYGINRCADELEAALDVDAGGAE